MDTDELRKAVSNATTNSIRVQIWVASWEKTYDASSHAIRDASYNAIYIYEPHSAVRNASWVACRDGLEEAIC